MLLKEKILEVIRGPRLAAVATVSEESGQMLPAVRYMNTIGYDNLTLMASTMKSSRKIRHIKKNPNVALTIWMEEDYDNPYVMIEARAEVHEDTETKKAFWSKSLENYFKGLDDIGYVVLKYVPAQIEYYSKMGVEVWPEK